MKIHGTGRRICTMNCGPARGDTRTHAERQRDCPDCLDQLPKPAKVHQSAHVAWMCPHDPDAATAFVWAKPGEAPPKCTCCGALRVAVIARIAS